MTYTITLTANKYVFEFLGNSWAYEGGVIINPRHSKHLTRPDFIQAVRALMDLAPALWLYYDWEERRDHFATPFGVREMNDCDSFLARATDALAAIESGVKVDVFDGDVNVLEFIPNTLETAIREVEAYRDALLARVKKRKFYDNREAVFRRDLGRCRYCDTRLETNYAIDHVIPKSRGGSNDLDNLVLTCKSCNSRKGARTPEEAGMSLRPIP